LPTFSTNLSPNVLVKNFPFIISLSTVTLSHRQFVSAGTDCYRGQRNDKNCVP
jgi:hypothetical protein